MKTKSHIVTVEDHPLLACSQMIKEQNLDGLSQSIRDAEARQDQELLDLLLPRQRAAHEVLYEKAIGILNEFKQKNTVLFPLDRPVIVRLAALEKVLPEEISEDLKQQVEGCVAPDGKTRDEIGQVVNRDGQSLAAVLKNLVAEGRLVKRGGVYSLPVTESVEVLNA